MTTTPTNDPGVKKTLVQRFVAACRRLGRVTTVINLTCTARLNVQDGHRDMAD